MRTWIPAIQAARRLAPTAWKRRPAAVERSTKPTTSISTNTSQNSLADAEHLVERATSDSASGTVALLAVPSRYSAVIPSRISPVDSVTISGLSSSTATSTPLTRPITTPITKTTSTAYGEAVVLALGHADEDVGEQRDRRAHRQVDPTHHDHEHLAEGDDGDDAAERAAGVLHDVDGQRLGGDDPADDRAATPVASQIVTNRELNSRLLDQRKTGSEPLGVLVTFGPTRGLSDAAVTSFPPVCRDSRLPRGRPPSPPTPKSYRIRSG